MNIFNEIYRDQQKRRAEAQKNAEEHHQEELVRLGISEEQYQEIKKRDERNERIKDTTKGIMAFIGLVAVIIGTIAFFSSDFGGKAVMWIDVAIVLGLLLIGIWFVCEFVVYPALRNWKATKYWKIIITVVVSLLIVSLVIWITGTGPDINPPIHERP